MSKSLKVQPPSASSTIRASRWHTVPVVICLTGASLRANRRASLSVAMSPTSAVTALLHSGRIKVLPGACPNLLAEAELYRYGDDATDRRAESPVDEDNHALAALRYLVLALDGGRSVRTGPAETPEEMARKKEDRERQKQREWLSVWNEELWTPLF
jgi:hypothetical protein